MPRSRWLPRWIAPLLAAFLMSAEAAMATQKDPALDGLFQRLGTIDDPVAVVDLSAKISAYNAAATGASRRIRRLSLQRESLSFEAGEVTEKGTINQRAVRARRAEQIAALRRVAGDKVAARIRREPDALIVRIVAGWPHRFEAKRARALGFQVEGSFDEIIRVHIEEDLGGTFVA